MIWVVGAARSAARIRKLPLSHFSQGINMVVVAAEEGIR